MRTCTEENCRRQATRRWLCSRCYQRRRRHGTLPADRMPNQFIQEAKALYEELRAVQDARIESYSVGYERERRLYFSEVEPAVRLADCLKAVAREYRHRSLTDNAA